MTDGDGILLTGATGFVGMELLARYAERGDRNVYALIRADSDAEAGARLASTLERVGARPPQNGWRVRALAADLEHEGLGLDEHQRLDLAEHIGTIIHSAASVSFTLPIDAARRINVEGTRAMLEFAEEARNQGGLNRFAYVSTAYVAGDHAGTFHEDDLDVGQGFRNTYEQSKHEAETLVREYSERLPVQVFRPSIVVGERRSGWTASFNVLYAPLKAFVRGALPFLPADRAAPVDVVPVDYVADAICALADEPLGKSGETFHLVSGRDATTVGGLTASAAAHLDRRPPHIVWPSFYRRLLHPVLTRVGDKRKRARLASSEVFFPYFTMKVRFDNRRCRERLAGHRLEAPAVEHYLDRLLDFARFADWGRREPVRPRHGPRRV